MRCPGAQAHKQQIRKQNMAKRKENNRRKEKEQERIHIT